MRKRITLLLTFLMTVPLLPFPARGSAAAVQSGDRVVIWNETASVALSAVTVDGIYQSGVPVTAEEDALQGYGDSEIWTLWQNEDGTWRLENGGVYLGLDSETWQLSMGGALDCWKLTQEGQLKNRDVSRYLAWYSAREVFCAAKENLGENLLSVYRLSTESEETEAPTEAPTETEPPTEVPTEMEPPTEAPTETEPPTEAPTETEPPTEAPTETETPTEASTETEAPTEVPTETEAPTEAPFETQPAESACALDTGSWKLCFGLLHAHTADSDGTGTAQEAFAYASAVEGLDFFAVTDHSDSFDNDKEGTLTADGTAISAEWAAGKAAAEAVTDADFVGIYGFEISWNQAQGHISTFNTPGWISRDREGYSRYRDGLENYYEALLEVPNSISQLNHPGTVYGDFKNFAYISPQVDALVTLLEVGCGEETEYQIAYEAYTKSLDQGWHLAPTNNQNNHESTFGDADTNRTVVLAAELTEAAIYDALRNYRVYATEDSDLQIYYTLNGHVMGSVISAWKLGDTAEISVGLWDPTDSDWGTVEVITQGGAVAASAVAAEAVTFSLPTAAAYYYLRITQPDGDIAVTAPIWLRQRGDFGISSLKTENALTRVDVPQTVQLELYNNETEALTVTSVTLTDEAGNVLGTYGEEILEAFAARTISFPVCFPADGVQKLMVTVHAIFDAETQSLSETLELSVLPKSVISEILIDGTHGAACEYTELLSLAARQQISARVETVAITEKQLETCRLLVIPSPTAVLEPEFLELVINYVNQGGDLLLLGTAGGSEELNRLLDAMGTAISLNPDTAVDEVSNGGSPDQLYSAVFSQHILTEGIREGQTYAHLTGCSLTAGEDQWLVKGQNGAVLLAAEGGVILAGSDFLADACLSVSDDPWALPYANRTVLENILGVTRTAPQITPVASVRGGELGRIYLVEGLVTAGTHNVNTTFPDTIYIQDATGGIAAVGYSEPGLELGRRVRILGCLEENDGNPQLQIRNIEILEKQAPITPEAMSSALDYALQGGELLQLWGRVISLEGEGESVRSFVLENNDGDQITVWVEPAILSGSLGRNELARKTVQVGNEVSAVGICHLRNGVPVLKIRDCDEVIALWAPWMETNGNPATGDTAFPAWAPVTLIASLTMLSLLLKLRRI